MADDDEDDYLSDKFLLQNASASGSKPSTYAERRRQAQKEAAIRNEQNRKKSRRQLEEESREEGLRKSLFEKAQEEAAVIGTQNKAMNMMLKMGFKPGQSLGRSDDDHDDTSIPGPSQNGIYPEGKALGNQDYSKETREDRTAREYRIKHRTEPLPLDVWTGKKGVGLGKRAPSPSALTHAAKVAKVSEENVKETFRERARREFEEKRAEGRLFNAMKTLRTLDEKSGITFNIHTLDPNDPQTFPPDFIEALEQDAIDSSADLDETVTVDPERLRRQMRLDALQPIQSHLEDEGEPVVKKPKLPNRKYSEKTIEDAKTYLQLGSQQKLVVVLAHLRNKYTYCFWCGTQYDDRQDMAANCPGEDEEAHD
ncbi:hypothetical protein BD410DRAFT_779649 [Rickenella mellea]|uniref:G-patch domain-containing protein n=1 Tax=Rickenella mellea TaxID=50990 RepID=A0A4R5XG21_9AGAM|nr:hypothetical protein BD410DRAFT_779649 [Rickenella mellea]